MNKKKMNWKDLADKKLDVSDWRYSPVPIWVLDRHLSYNPEDEMIADIDGEGEPAYADLTFTYHSALEEFLNTREARIVDMKIGDGMSFSEIGNDYGISKQRVHQIYCVAIEKLKGSITYVK